jgi:zinc transporter, ZIP family
LAAVIARPGHGRIARVMAFGAGALLGTVSIQLIVSAQRHAGLARATLFLLIGALLFSFVNVWLARAGARNRKRCGECVPQENEHDKPGSGQAIAIGTIVDALPEGLVLGVAVAQGAAPTIAILAGFFLANVPESLSGSAGMYLAGRSMRYIFSVWATAGLVTPLGAVVGSLVFARASPEMAGCLDALSGGILLALALETMIPEGFDKSPLFSGTVAVLGFAVIAVVTAVT